MISKNQLKTYRSLKTKKYRISEGKFLIEGNNLCEAALESEFSIELILISSAFANRSSSHNLKTLIEEKKAPFEIVEDKVVYSLSESLSPQGVVAVLKIPEVNTKDIWHFNPTEILILDRISDPGNLGTIIRSADWFGIRTIVCSSNCADLYNGKVLRSSAGSIFHLPLIMTGINLVDFMRQLIERKYSVFIADPGADNSYLETSFPRPFAVIVGNERQGVRSEIQCIGGTKINIPKKGKAESLNAAVAASILLAEACK